MNTPTKAVQVTETIEVTTTYWKCGGPTCPHHHKTEESANSCPRRLVGTPRPRQPKVGIRYGSNLP